MEGTGVEVPEPPKRLKKTTTTNEKENEKAIVSKSAVKAEKKSRKAVPASAKKTSAKRDQPSQQQHVDVMQMKVAQLKTELNARNLDSTGLKKVLQARLLKHIQEEESKKRQESRSVIKSAKKAKTASAAAAVSSSAKKKDRDGDVRMEDVDATNDSRRDSSKMDVDEDDASSRMKKDAAPSSTAKETTVAKSFLKNTAELFSPNKIAAKVHHSAKKDKAVVDLTSSAVKEKKAEATTTHSGRSSLTAGLKKTASAFLSASSPAHKAPSSSQQRPKSPFVHKSAMKSSASSVVKPKEAPVAKDVKSHQQKVDQSKTSDGSNKSEQENQPLNVAPAPAIPSKLGSLDNNAGAATKAKRNKCTADRMARLAEIRGKSKPVASAKSVTTKDLPVLSATKGLKLGSAKAKDSKSERKLLLTAQMREKAALKSQAAAATAATAKAPVMASSSSSSSSSSKLVSSQQQQQTSELQALAPPATSATNVPSSSKVTASPVKALLQKKQVASSSSGKATKASSSKKKKASRPDVLSPMSTYEMSDREHSDSDESESESYHHRKRKNIPSWAKKDKLLPALENQYANANGQLDPEIIFPPVQTCDLEKIFGGKKDRYNRRTSSANWSKDGVTVNEIINYKRTMGY